MDKKIRLLATLLCVVTLFACSKHHKEDLVIGPYTPSISSPIKIKISDVSNDTHKVFDVDVIGLLWTGLEDSLKKRGMLWNQQAGGQPYTLEGHVLKFKKGSAPGRLLPWYGDSLLEVRCELMNGPRHLATIEVKRKISYGHATMTRGVWREIFTEVSEEVVNQALRKL